MLHFKDVKFTNVNVNLKHSLHIDEVRTSKEKKNESIIKIISAEFSVDQVNNDFNCKCYIIGSLLLTGSM